MNMLNGRQRREACKAIVFLVDIVKMELQCICSLTNGGMKKRLYSRHKEAIMAKLHLFGENRVSLYLLDGTWRRSMRH